MDILIDKRKVGEGHPCYIIAEAGSNHDGKLEQAKQLIDIAADAGADAVKFQVFSAKGMVRVSQLVHADGKFGVIDIHSVAIWIVIIPSIYFAQYHRGQHKDGHTEFPCILYRPADRIFDIPRSTANVFVSCQHTLYISEYIRVSNAYQHIAFPRNILIPVI